MSPVGRICTAGWVAVSLAGMHGAVDATGAGDAPATKAPTAWFFDDFNYPTVQAMQEAGWQIRSVAGHPGIPGARWAPEGVTLVDDVSPPAFRPGVAGPAKGRKDANGSSAVRATPTTQGATLAAPRRLLMLRAATDGTGPGTTQVQVCHQRKYLEGTYAARVRFSDQPVSGADGDPVIQTFYAVSPLRFDFDPEFSELDWEYLPNGGWGSDKTRLYGITWQTVRLDPWLAYNQQHEEFAQLGAPGNEWHTLVMQAADGRTRWFVDGRQVAEHGGRNYPVVQMSINFNLWFSPGGPLPQGGAPRVYEQAVDWVVHARHVVLSPEQIEAQVAQWRQRGVGHVDQVSPPMIPLENRCDF